MDVVGRANVDHVYRLVGEQVVKRAISAINTQGVAVVLAAVGGAGKHSLNRDALAAERFEVGLAHKANTNDGGAKFGLKNENRRLTYVCVLAHRADYGETTLDGLCFSVFVKWPGAIHEGGGEGLVLEGDDVAGVEEVADFLEDVDDGEVVGAGEVNADELGI